MTELGFEPRPPDCRIRFLTTVLDPRGMVLEIRHLKCSQAPQLNAVDCKLRGSELDKARSVCLLCSALYTQQLLNGRYSVNIYRKYNEMYHCIHRVSSLIQTGILFSVQVHRMYKSEQKYF